MPSPNPHYREQRYEKNHKCKNNQIHHSQLSRQYPSTKLTPKGTWPHFCGATPTNESSVHCGRHGSRSSCLTSRNGITASSLSARVPRDWIKAAGSGWVTRAAGSLEKRTSWAVPRFFGITQRVPVAVVVALTSENFGLVMLDFFNVDSCSGNDRSDILC